MIQKIVEATTGGHAHFIRILLQGIQTANSRFWAALAASWWGIEIGPGCSFVGVVRFRRTPSSEIKIGARCRLLSAPSSNQHGLFRKCMISTLKRGARVEIGDDVGMSGTVIACAESVKIGDRVFLGANTTVTDTDSHPIDYRERSPAFYGIRDQHSENTKTGPIIIEDDVFVGMNSIILKGVHIGRGAVIGAGSIVTRNVPAFSVANGNPAQTVKKLDS